MVNKWVNELKEEVLFPQREICVLTFLNLIIYIHLRQCVLIDDEVYTLFYRLITVTL